MTSELSPNSAFSTHVLIKVWRKESKLGEPLAVLGVGGGAKSMLCLSQGAWGDGQLGWGLRRHQQVGIRAVRQVTGEGAGGNGPILSTNL